MNGDKGDRNVVSYSNKVFVQDTKEDVLENGISDEKEKSTLGEESAMKNDEVKLDVLKENDSAQEKSMEANVKSDNIGNKESKPTQSKSTLLRV